MSDKEIELAIAEKYEEIMNLLGIQRNEDNMATPMRVARSLMEMTHTESLGKHSKELLKGICTVFNSNNPGIKIVQDEIEFSSMCSHHHLPFFGKVRITYVADSLIIGLSKFARIVEFFSKKPQVQENLTYEIGNFLVEILNPLYVKVEIYDCTHTCMSCRGVNSLAKTSTEWEYNPHRKNY